MVSIARPGQAFVATACPTCGGPLVIRTQRATRKTFAGCLAYPNCTGSISFPRQRRPKHTIIQGGAAKARPPD